MPHAASYTRPRLDLGEALLQFPLTQPGFIGLEILPVFGTAKKTATFTAITRETITATRDTTRKARAAYARDDHETEDQNFTCKEYGFEQALDDSERELYATDYDAEMVAAQIARDVLLREQEKRIASAIFNTTTWTGAALYTDVSTDWDSSSGTIVADVMSAKEKVRQNCGLPANTVIFSAAHIPSLMKNTDLIARISYNQVMTAGAVMSVLPALFGVDRVLIGGSVKNSSDEGVAYSGADIWSDDYCWVGVTARTNSLAEPCVGRTFLWTADSPDNAMIEEYREEQTRSSIFRARQHTDEKVIDEYFGHLLLIDT